MMLSSFDHVVIGGGPAGAMTAFRLAAAGCEVILLEKQREPHHKVCGEFLSAEAMGYLDRIGVDPRALGARPIHRVRLHTGHSSVHTELPFSALSLSRRTLDEALLKRATTAGAYVRRGAFVERLVRHGDTFCIQLSEGKQIQSRNVFLGTGKHDLAEIPRGKGSHPDLVGFKMHWQLAPDAIETIRHSMELFLFRHGYGGLALIEDDVANLCFVTRQIRLRQLGNWRALLDTIRQETPAIDSILRGAEQCWPKPLAISPIPYGYFAESAEGIWRIGDQAAVIPSFTGDGMSIALHSGDLAAEMYLSGRTPDAYLACLREQLSWGMRFASGLSRLMVTSAGRILAPLSCSVAPGIMSWIAAQTRIPNSALNATHAVHRHSPIPVA